MDQIMEQQASTAVEPTNYTEIDGDLIALAKEGKFDVIAHGCNCHCTMGAGIAPLMAEAFGCDEFIMEQDEFSGDINKLGTIDYEDVYLKDGIMTSEQDDTHTLTVVNAYTQYGFGRNHKGGKAIPLDYEALTLVLRKMNQIFEGKHIGLPLIGGGLAGGDPERIKSIIKEELQDCTVTLVLFTKPTTPYVFNSKSKIPRA